MEARENVSLYCSKLEGKKKETVFEGAGLIFPETAPFECVNLFSLSLSSSPGLGNNDYSALL